MKLRSEIDRLLAFAGHPGLPAARGMKKQNSSRTKKIKKNRYLVAMIAAGALSGAADQAFAQPALLPVYHVVQPGASQSQANMLAADLGIPLDQLSVSNGEVLYVDPNNFMNIPTMPVTDPTAISNLLAQTVNQSSNFPINLEQIDFVSLSNRVVLDDASAQAFALSALADSGLTPTLGSPGIAHTTLDTYMNLPGGGMSSNSQPLDTEMRYQFVDTNGYPFIGPGAQVHVAFDGSGNATRLVYSWRQVTPGQQVRIIPEAVARARVAGMFPAGAQITDDIDYICPPNWPHWHWCPGCPPPPHVDVENVLPYYVFHASTLATNPVDGQVTQVQSLMQAIPATDDPMFVPALNLSVSNMADGSVSANVAVTGGTGPYTYSWSGSSTALPESSIPGFNYTPMVRIVQPQLQIHQNAAGGGQTISWNQGPGEPVPWILESAPVLNGDPASWTQVPGPIQTNNGTYSVVANYTGPTRFFRLRLQNSTVPITENVNVLVTDMNGVSVPANQTLVVPAVPIIVSNSVIFGGPCQPQWGTESPVDPGLGSIDRGDWTSHMLADPGAGTQSFLWTLNSAWLGDFIDPAIPHVLGFNPQTSGDDDYHNWGVDGADITLYIGHGNPTAITFSVTPALFFNNPDLVHSWGDDADFGYHPAAWLCLLSCEVLSNNWAGLNAVKRWGSAFNGLHVLTGFQSPAQAQTGFPATFADNMLLGVPQTVVKSWFNSATVHGTGQAAAMGPIGPGGSLNYNDHYWCKGPVGPTIKANQIQGWWYVSQ
jgi:hypothetical protein